MNDMTTTNDRWTEEASLVWDEACSASFRSDDQFGTEKVISQALRQAHRKGSDEAVSVVKLYNDTRCEDEQNCICLSYLVWLLTEATGDDIRNAVGEELAERLTKLKGV